jgi:hypothetical protein
MLVVLYQRAARSLKWRHAFFTSGCANTLNQGVKPQLDFCSSSLPRRKQTPLPLRSRPSHPRRSSTREGGKDFVDKPPNQLQKKTYIAHAVGHRSYTALALACLQGIDI